MATSNAEKRPVASTHRAVPKSSGTYLITMEGLDYDDDLTPIRMCCMVCKGRVVVIQELENGYKSTRCTWCTDGVMTSDQINTFMSREEIKERDIEEMLKNYVDDQAK